MCFTAIASLLGGVVKAGASMSAARSQERAARDQLDLSNKMYEETKGASSPYREAGKSALSAYGFNLGLNERPEGYEGIKASEGFNAQLGMGRDAIEAGAVGRGGLYSGSTMSALERYRSKLASTEVNTQLDRLAGLSSQGLNATNLQAGAGATNVQFGSNALSNIGNAQAGGTIGAANAFTDTLNTGLGLYGFFGQQDNQRATRNPMDLMGIGGAFNGGFR